MYYLGFGVEQFLVLNEPIVVGFLVLFLFQFFKSFFELGLTLFLLVHQGQQHFGQRFSLLRYHVLLKLDLENSRLYTVLQPHSANNHLEVFFGHFHHGERGQL